MKVEYLEYKLETVLNHFAAGFRPKAGTRIVSHQTPIVDIVRGVVAFKVYTEEDSLKSTTHKRKK